MICAPCSVGLYEECENPQPAGASGGWIIPCGLLQEELTLQAKPRSGIFRDPSELSDDVSAGRKRAAMAAPITNGMPCEWAGLKFAGGGVVPILGCRGNTIAQVKSTEDAKALGFDEVGHLHHGPDKNVVNNTPGGNLHRVCSRCHTRWHSLNNPHYGDRPHPSLPYLPTVPYFGHDPITVFTDAEFEQSEKWWAIRDKAKRPEYPFKPEGVRILLPVSEPSGSVATANPFEDGDPHEDEADH